VGGLNVPGVTTISGKEMGGWIQYSMSPTTAAWLAQHFYWQWKYGMDNKFLLEKVHPYFEEVKKFLSSIAVRKNNGDNNIQLPLSSSPEYYDNSIKAWFTTFTNYDLALVKNFYHLGTEIVSTTNRVLPKDWVQQQQLLPPLDFNETGITIAQGQNLDESHRHHAHLVSIYPLGLLDPADSAQRQMIDQSLRWLEKIGTRNWCGYSFSWAACIYARAKDGNDAVTMLKIFAANFCSSNSFHLNGDQNGGQYSSFTYRPFTLEGNFAFAQGIHEMLIQSYNGHIEIFPAIPGNWKNISFDKLRTEGAFLVSASKENGRMKEVVITSEKGNLLLIKLPFKNWLVKGIDPGKVHDHGNEITAVLLKKGQKIVFKNADE
jgi:alpha-L-fucosidase 2